MPRRGLFGAVNGLRLDGCEGNLHEALGTAAAQPIRYRGAGHQACGQRGCHGLLEHSDWGDVVLIRGTLKIVELRRDLPNRPMTMRDLD